MTKENNPVHILLHYVMNNLIILVSIIYLSKRKRYFIFTNWIYVSFGIVENPTSLALYPVHILFGKYIMGSQTEKT